MANISLLDMKKTKKRNVREAIISVLGRKFPLSIKKIYNEINKEYKLGVTYQAVFKLIKEMAEENMLDKIEKEYQLNMGWIKDLENELSIIKKNYTGEKPKEDSMQKRTNKFVSKLGPEIKEYAGKDKVCIIGVSGGGRIFGMALFKYLLRESINAKYFDINWIDQLSKGRALLKKEGVRSKKIILVDSEIYSGKTYEIVMAYMNKIKEKFNIKEIKFVVDRDVAGLADFSVTKI